MEVGMKKIVIVFVTLLCAFGCAPSKKYVWTKPGSTPEGFKKDQFDCKVISRNLYNQEMASAPVYAPRQAQTTGAAMQGFGESMQAAGYSARASESAKKIFNECMEARGYSLVER